MLNIRKGCQYDKYGAGRLKKKQEYDSWEKYKNKKKEKKIKNEYDNKKIEKSI